MRASPVNWRRVVTRLHDLTRRIRKANPYAEQALPDHASRTLDEILDGRREPDWTRSAPSQPVQHRRRPLLIVGSGFAAIAIVVVLVVLVVLRPAPALAVTPSPLALQPTSWTLESLREDMMKPAPNTGVSTSQRGAEWEGWFLQLDTDTPTTTFIQPQHTQIEWDEDLSGTSRVVAEAPTTADGTPIEPVPSSAAAIGTTLSEEDWGPGELAVPFPTAPPDDVDGMRAYLQAFLQDQGVTDTAYPSAGEYVLAVTSLMQVWTLSDAAQRSAIAVILSAPGVTVAGETTDRAGRPGIALDIEPTELQPGYSTQLIIDPDTRRILATESITIDGLPEFDVPSGSVTDYTIWEDSFR